MLNIELGGTAAGQQYDVLSVAGVAQLAGTLNVARINNFPPSAQGPDAFAFDDAAKL